MQEEKGQLQAAPTSELSRLPKWRLVATIGGAGGTAAAIQRPGDTEVLTVLGGKASCRRKFVLHLQLLDEQGHAVKPVAATGLSIIASVAFAHDHSPVLVPGPSAGAGTAAPAPGCSPEPPLFTTFHGVEFPAHSHPTLLDSSGCASFKLSISLLSSKFDNRLFCICFTPHQQVSSCPPCFSTPIRSISRKRNPVRAQLDAPAPHHIVSPYSSRSVFTTSAAAAAPVRSCGKESRASTASHERCTEEPPRCCEETRYYAPVDVYENSQKRTYQAEPPPQEMISGVASPSNSETLSAEAISCSDESIDQGFPGYPQKERTAPRPWRPLQLDNPFERPASSPSLQAAASRQDHVGNEPRILRPVARVGACRLPFLFSEDHHSRDRLQTWNSSTVQVVNCGARSMLQQSMEEIMESVTFNRKVMNATATDQGPQYAGDEEDQEEERAIRYLELTLAEMSREIQRRKEEMVELRRKRRRRVAMHDQDPYHHPGGYLILQSTNGHSNHVT